jgi:cerevisin
LTATLDDLELKNIRAHQDVESVQEDGKANTFDSITLTDATWGLQRISQEGPIGSGTPDDLSFTYTYNSGAGAGVDVYVVGKCHAIRSKS